MWIRDPGGFNNRKTERERERKREEKIQKENRFLQTINPWWIRTRYRGKYKTDTPKFHNTHTNIHAYIHIHREKERKRERERERERGGGEREREREREREMRTNRPCRRPHQCW